MLLTEPGALLLIYFLCILSPGWCAIVNRTIDDSSGDSATGVLPVYLPRTVGIWKNQTCTNCLINPDVRQTFKKSYTAAVYSPELKSMSISMQFNGTAIYVFFILANSAGGGVTPLTDCNFTLDGLPPKNFKHAPDLTTTALEYNSLAYSQTNLPNALHTLNIVTEGVNYNVYVNFDYAIYTHDDDPLVSSSPSISRSSSIRPVSTSRPVSSSTTRSVAPSHSPSASVAASSGSSTTPVGAIVGGVVGGLVLLIALVFALLFCLRRRKRDILITDHWRTVPPLLASEFDEPMGQQPAYNPVLYPQNAPFSFPPSASGVSNYPFQASTSMYDPYRNSLAHTNPSNATTYDNDASGGTVVGAFSSTASQSGVQGGVYMHAPSSSGHRSSTINPNFTFPPVAPPIMMSPNPSSDPQERIRLARQQEIDERLRTVQQEMRDLSKDLKGGRMSIRRDPMENRGREEEEQEMTISEMKEQMRFMQEQISFLRENQRSAWAQGLTDDPPPGYTPTNSMSRRVSHVDVL